MNLMQYTMWASFAVSVLRKLTELMDTITDDVPLSSDSARVSQELSDLANVILTKIAAIKG